jgi:hypothetical protein
MNKTKTYIQTTLDADQITCQRVKVLHLNGRLHASRTPEGVTIEMFCTIVSRSLCTGDTHLESNEVSAGYLTQAEFEELFLYK